MPPNARQEGALAVLESSNPQHPLYERYGFRILVKRIMAFAHARPHGPEPRR